MRWLFRSFHFGFFLAIITLFTSCSMYQKSVLKEQNLSYSEKNIYNKAKFLAEQKWGYRIYPYGGVHEVKLIESSATSKLLRNHTVFQVKVFNRGSEIAGPPYHYHSIIFNSKDVIYLENSDSYLLKKKDMDLEVVNILVKLLIEKNKSLIAKDKVGLFLKAFGELRGFKFIEKIPSFPDDIEESTKPEDWEVKISDIENGWEVSSTFLVDRNINAYNRYNFKFYNSGEVIPKVERQIYVKGVYY